VQAGVEECDDGNDVTTDDCLPVFCKSAICTDGYIQEGVEDCDDGNQDDGDDCPSSCATPFCGDGFTWNGMEECDDGNDMSNDGCTPECIAEYCFKIENDGQENLMGNSWFDQCVAAPGSNVMVTLRDANDQVVYTATGTQENNWTNDNITSNAAAGNQYQSANHNWMIDLDNGDKLMITGRFSSNSGCGGSFGNGYGIVIYPDPPNYYTNPKMLVMGYKGGISNQARSFTGWSAATEISWNNGASMNTCNGVNAFTGSFELSVSG
jgi:cysteine-rich repeat protein